jgi:hypothetical protein
MTGEKTPLIIHHPSITTHHSLPINHHPPNNGRPRRQAKKAGQEGRPTTSGDDRRVERIGRGRVVLVLEPASVRTLGEV